MRTLTTVAAFLAASALAVAAPANASGRLTLAGTGTSEVSAASIDIAGEVSGTPISGPYTGTIVVPGGVPPVGECAPAYAAVTVGPTSGATITLGSQGEVCSTIVPWILHDFRGRFEVTETSKRGWRKITGFLDVRALNGLSDVYATG